MATTQMPEVPMDRTDGTDQGVGAEEGEHWEMDNTVRQMKGRLWPEYLGQ